MRITLNLILYDEVPTHVGEKKKKKETSRWLALEVIIAVPRPFGDPKFVIQFY